MLQTTATKHPAPRQGLTDERLQAHVPSPQAKGYSGQWGEASAPRTANTAEAAENAEKNTKNGESNETTDGRGCTRMGLLEFAVTAVHLLAAMLSTKSFRFRSPRLCHNDVFSPAHDRFRQAHRVFVFLAAHRLVQARMGSQNGKSC